MGVAPFSTVPLKSMPNPEDKLTPPEFSGNAFVPESQLFGPMLVIAGGDEVAPEEETAQCISRVATTSIVAVPGRLEGIIAVPVS